MTITLEKIFFNYILNNPKYFEVVKSHFFKNSEISFVYNVVRTYMLEGNDKIIPSPKQILEMVSLEDKEGVITKEILKSILKVELGEYDEINFIIPKFNTWVLTNKIREGTTDIIDHTRNLDHVHDFDSAINAATKIKEIMDVASSTNFIKDDEDLGSDFDDAEAHSQDNSTLKVRTGFNTIDTMTGGGFDVCTLNMLMAETNAGKSLWMQNFAVNVANLGYNVLYVTLEMTEKKVLKRMGSMRLKIPIDKYDDLSKDIELIKRKIAGLRRTNSDDVFENKVGKIFTKFWAAGTIGVDSIDNYIEKLRDKKGVKIDFIIVDYLTLLVPPKGLGDNLYLKGKSISEGLRALGAKWKAPVLTAIQVAKDAWNATDVTLQSIPESKAIAETADTFFAIIRTEEMKRNNQYRIKLLKQRDGGFSRSQAKFDLNPTYLTIENELFLDFT